MKFWLGIFVLLAIGCSKSENPQSPPQSSTPTAERGRIVYQTNCTACHHSDPRKPGAIGPEIFKSSRELIEARVLKGEYPPGYQPKRQTKTMAPLPHLKNDIDSLYLFLKGD